MDRVPTVFLHRNLGAPFLGLLAAAILYGLNSLQTLIFLRRKSDYDGLWLKRTIMALWVTDSLHTAFNTHSMYHYLVISFGDLRALQKPIWSILVPIYITTTSDLVVRLIFSRRIYLLLREQRILAIILVVFINLLSVISVSFGAVLASTGFGLETYLEFERRAWAIYSAFICTAVADLFIAIILSILLIRSRTGFRRTDSMISFLVALAINTGLLTSLCAFACVAIYAIWPDNLVFFAIYIPLSKLYLNSLLVSLNTRDMVRSMGTATGVNSGSPFFSGPLMLGTKETTDIPLPSMGKIRERDADWGST